MRESEESAARFHALRRNTTLVLRRALLAQVGWLTERLPNELLGAVLDELDEDGELGQRRLWRNLRWLRENGWIERRQGGYVRARARRNQELR